MEDWVCVDWLWLIDFVLFVYLNMLFILYIGLVVCVVCLEIECCVVQNIIQVLVGVCLINVVNCLFKVEFVVC